MAANPESTASFDELPSEPERYELAEPPAYDFRASRRGFVQTLGAGLVFAATARRSPAQRFGGRGGGRPASLTDRLHLSEEGRVTVLTSKVEVGQGSRTQLTQAAAEELGLPMGRIDLIMADTRLCPDDGGTAGSRTTPSTVPQVRAACAAARELLLGKAAERLAAPVGEVTHADGIYRAPGGKTLTLGELARESPLDGAPAGRQAQVRRVDEWTVLGTPAPKVGGEAVVTGRHQYTSDLRLPGMLYGKVLRQPSYGAVLKGYATDQAAAMEGVVVVEDNGFVGCVAPTSYQAAQAIEAIAATAEWERPSHPSSAELDEHLKRTASAGGRGGRGGPPNNAAVSGEPTLEAEYSIAYIQHAPMEPRAAVAQWEQDGLTVWTGSQMPSRVQGELQQAFGLAAEKVRVIVPDTGGGFGGKHTGEAAVEAARLARSAGKPVSLRWTREEEFTWAYFRPAGVIQLAASLDADGRITRWEFTNINSGNSAIDTPYRVPGARSRSLNADAPLRQGSYRALASTANVFAREAAMDELAALAGADPLAFRLAHLDAGRLRGVLVAAAEKFDFQRRRTAGEAVGLACGTEKGSYVAACVAVELAGDTIRVKSVCQAYECGAIHNPKNLRAQVEGAIVMGLGGALTEKIEFEGGRITNPSFSTYQVPRMADLPEMDLVLLDRQDLASVGAGETPLIAVAPAIANALWVLTGRRCRSLPLRA